MDAVAVEPQKRRGRKRKVTDEQNAIVDCDRKRRGLLTRSLKLVGKYVLKEFRGSGMFLGKIVSYDSGLYRINYDDGDFEDLDSNELRAFLLEDGDLIGVWLERKDKLDSVLNQNLHAKFLEVCDTKESERVKRVDVSLSSDLGNEKDGAHDDEDALATADSSSESCEDSQELGLTLPVGSQLLPPLELPPSSGHIGVPVECVSHLLSVYNFLRSFSIQLFLYPFELDEFVGAINCSAANTLLDSVHVALMHVLKRHLERLVLEGSEFASKCLRFLDWSLVDALTWPVYVVHYLAVMGYIDGPEWKGFIPDSLERDYYTSSAVRKLSVLQILCDDVLDSEELRGEMDTREELEIGIDLDNVTACTSTVVPRRAHPRFTKNSATRDGEATQSTAINHHAKPFNHFAVSQVVEPSGGSTEEDENGDECRLCGMDGFLLCCDGCPSSYHSRCLGLNKTYMPEGSWYCPECKISAREPKILQGTKLRGGVIFGVDLYDQVFITTCDHLLVLNASVNSGNCLRYYSKHDIPSVLHALYSRTEYAIMYSDICKEIMQHWELPGSTLPHNEMHETDLHLHLANTENSGCSQLVSLLEESVDMAEVCISGTNIADPTAVVNTTYHVDGTQDPKFAGSNKTEYAQSEPGSKSSLFTEITVNNADHCELSLQNSLKVSEVVTNIPRDLVCPVNGNVAIKKMFVSSPQLNNNVDYKNYGRPYDGCVYMGSSFKTSDYVNYYLHGDFSAAAACSLAILSSEENQVSDPRTSSNRRKVLTDAVSHQLKAFSSVAMRFFWPNTEKKLVEVPRERCSWCFSCKAPVSSRKGCLLNAAASNTIKGAIKLLSSVRSVKNGDARLPGIATYVMFIEECLRGLVVGPFLSDSFRKQWRKQVEQASTFTSMKILLIELEENIRSIALSEDWLKFVDGVSGQPSTSQVAASVPGSTQKRKPGRPGRKPSHSVEIAIDDNPEEQTDYTWWRGGSLSKLLFQRGFLPCSVTRRAARQGGSKKIPGIHYVEGQETPKRTRQLVWRSAVEMCRSIAQLAHQVRCFDVHLRWGDLVRPEQIASDAKGPETEASAFRNAFICDKKTVENDSRYCVAFGSQKHLPSRVMKYITEVENILADGKERYWFSEKRIPLYLIKEYEEKACRDKCVDVLSKLQKKQLKALHKNIFSYLSLKRDNMERDYCCSCNQDLLYRNAVQCSACQGFCHEMCASSSTIQVKEEVEFFITCKQCCESRRCTPVDSTNGSPTSPLLLKGRDFSQAASANKRGPSVGLKESPGIVRNQENPSAVKSVNRSSASKKSKIKSWGLIWKKKQGEDTGNDFRLKHLLWKGNPDMALTQPICCICTQPYNANLMYIRCETCPRWYHADALELDESKIVCLVGFKCIKCRRIKSPPCPYSNPPKKDLDNKMEFEQVLKPNISHMESDFGVISEHCREESFYFEMPVEAAVSHAEVSVSEVEQITDDWSEVEHEWSYPSMSVPGPQKLPVRRQVKQEKNVNYSQSVISASYEVSDSLAANDMSDIQESSNQVEWAVSNDNFDDGITLDYDFLGCDDEMDFEPQTYFSFNELLASDDVSNGIGSESLGKNEENLSGITQSEILEISYDQDEPTICLETEIHLGPCKICSRTEPNPDLSCQICGMWIHSHCSPWVEPSSLEEDWKCGHCRVWK